ncbi:MAG: DinB family protein [Luteolibacter sp.]
MKSLIFINTHLLDQAISLLRGLGSDEYIRPSDQVFSSTIGQHIRHCVEHYEEFLQALRQQRELDYEKRPRDLRVETDLREAARRLEAIREALGDNMPCRELRVWDNGSDSAAPSSVSRELQFLLSHTVHHFALIAVIARIAGRQVPRDFGIAPSTLSYRESA